MTIVTYKNRLAEGETILTDVVVDWVDEVPERVRVSPYDEVAERVRESGQIAKIKTSEGSLHTLAGRLRRRFTDLRVEGRKIPDEGYYVYMSRKEKPSSQH